MNKEITIESSVKRSDEYIASELDDGLVMMSLENNSYYGLDEIGKNVWEKIESETLVKDIISDLTTEYNVNIDECTNDILNLLDDLNKNGLLVVV